MNQASMVAESDVRAAVGVFLERTGQIGRGIYGVLERRAILATVLHADDVRFTDIIANRPGGWVRDKDAFESAVVDIYRSLGVAEGTRIPNALRAQVLAALGFREPPAPTWLVPGYRFHDPQRWPVGEDVTVARVTPEGVVLRGADGREEEPVPMGLFCAAHPMPPPRVYEEQKIELRTGGKVAAVGSGIVSVVARFGRDAMILPSTPLRLAPSAARRA